MPNPPRTQKSSNQTINKKFLMSITLHDRPQTLTPVYNDMMFIAGSTLASQQYFKMVVKVYHGGTLLKTLKYDKWPTGDFVQADVHRMLEPSYNFVIDNLALGYANFQVAHVTLSNYSVTFTEEINNTSISSGMVTASGYAFNASLKYLDWINFDYAQYNLTAGTQKSFLTNAPRTLRIRAGEAASLSFISLNKEAGNAYITTYNAAGGVINTHTINNTIYGGSSDGISRSLDFMCGTHNLGGTIITDDVAKYTVVMRNGTSAISEIFTFEIDRDCSRHQMFRLHFLNRLGRFDSFTFKGQHKQTTNFKRSEYQRFTGYTDLTGLTWENTSYARGNVVFDTEETEVYNISTGWISEEESQWLQELAGSPAVYWQIDPADPKKTIAVRITENSYEVKKNANKKLFSLNLTMELAQPNYRQRV